MKTSKILYWVTLIAHPTQHWQSTYVHSSHMTNFYPREYVPPTDTYTSNSECFLKTVRSPFPFLLLLRISFHSDVDRTLVLKGWPQKGKGKKSCLSISVVYSSSQSSSLFSPSKQVSRGKRKRKPPLLLFINSCKPPLLLCTPQVPNFVCHPSGPGWLYALYLCKNSHILFKEMCASS